MPDHRTYRADHSYIIELKYLPASSTPDKAEAQWQEAVSQVNRYAADEHLQAMLKGTSLHKVIVQMQGAELLRMEEVE